MTGVWRHRAIAGIPAIALAFVLFSWSDPVLPVNMSKVGPAALDHDMARLVGCCFLAPTLILGPGLVLRSYVRRLAQLPIGFVPLPGIGLLAATSLCVWVTAPSIDAQTTTRTVFIAVLIVITGLMARVREPVIRADERFCIAVAGSAFTVALGRSLWSPGPAGELYGGSISRTLEVGNRSDSRIAYHVSTIITHGYAPYSHPSAQLFAPYSFSSRGPLPGMLATPIMLLSGTRSTSAFPTQAWTPFDAQGFMAYRVALMILAVCALLAVHTVVSLVANNATVRLAVAVTAATPFFIHDTYFTWPKWAAASGVLLAAYLIMRRRLVLAGFMVGFGYLMHPLVLLSVPGLLLFVLLVYRPSLTWRDGLAAAHRMVALLASLLTVLVGWRLVNGPNFDQSGFLSYLVQADQDKSPSFSAWLNERIESAANTLIPMRLPLYEADNYSINSVYSHSDRLVHFFFQYWTGLPFGLAIVFYPVLLVGLGAAFYRHPLRSFVLLFVPFFIFWIYWGSASTGLLREGMHVWVLTILIVWTLEVVEGRWYRKPILWSAIRITLLCRLVEVVAMMLWPSYDNTHHLISTGFARTDEAALTMIGAGVLALAALTWHATSTRAMSETFSSGEESAEILRSVPAVDIPTVS